MIKWTTKRTSEKLFKLTGWKMATKAAFTQQSKGYYTDFLLDKLPNRIEFGGRLFIIHLIKDDDGFSVEIFDLWDDRFRLNIYSKDDIDTDAPRFTNKNPAETLAQIIIWLIENGYMEVKK